MKIELEQVATLLQEQDNILILTHQYPDGDTLGSGGSLCAMLQQMGKHARFVCADPIPKKYDYMLAKIPSMDFTPEFVVATDVADRKLLGALDAEWGGRVDLCIDHHGSNQLYAKQTYVDSTAAATTEILFQLAKIWGIRMEQPILDCIFTGMSTDSGCFRYTNVTPRTHRMAAELMELGAHAAEINRRMFETTSRSRMELERMAIDSLEYAFDGQCAIMFITRRMLETSGALESDVEGLASIPRRIEGVKIGITLREKEDGKYKASVRTGTEIDASALCGMLGGGGHKQAAGCTLCPDPAQAKAKILQAAAQMLG